MDVKLTAQSFDFDATDGDADADGGGDGDNSSFLSSPMSPLIGEVGGESSMRILPGDLVRLEAEMGRVKRGVGKFTGRAIVEGNIVAEAEMMCAMRNTSEAA